MPVVSIAQTVPCTMANRMSPPRLASIVTTYSGMLRGAMEVGARWSGVRGELGVGPEIPVFPAKVGKIGLALPLVLVENPVPGLLEKVVDGVWLGSGQFGVGVGDS